MRFAKSTTLLAAAAAAALVLPSFARAQESNGDEGVAQYDIPLGPTTAGSPDSSGTFTAGDHNTGAPTLYHYNAVTVGPTTSLRQNWETSAAIPLGSSPAMPTTATLYQIDWLGAPGSATTNVQFDVINVNYNGQASIVGSDPSNNSNIPWAGAFGTNHQYNNYSNGTEVDGAWNETGSGPHNPDSAAFNAGAGGVYVWLKAGSELYVGSPDNGDFNGHNIHQIWSDLVLEEVPEPASLSLIGLAAGGLVMRRRRA